MIKATYFALTLFAFAVATVSADHMDFELEFDDTSYTATEVVGDDDVTYLRVEYAGADAYAAAPGTPVLPKMAYDVIVPFGSTNVSVELLDAAYYDAEEITHYFLPGQVPEPWEGEWEWSDPADDPYIENKYYPGDELDGYGKGLWRGHFACQCVLILAQYNPAAYEYKTLESATLRVNYTPPLSAPTAERWEWEHVYDRWSDYLKTFVLNPDDVYDNREPVHFVDTIAYSEYGEGGYTVTVAENQESEFYSSYVPIADDEEWPEEGTSFAYQYIIITNDYARHETGNPDLIDLTSALDDLVDWKTEKGVPVIYKTVDDIKVQDDYKQQGNEYWDWQVAVRRFLQAAAKYWGPEYVFFIGDVDHIPSGEYDPSWGQYGVVPIRCFGETDFGEGHPKEEPTVWKEAVSTDLYYVDLDFDMDWDVDEDGIFGEPTDDEVANFKPDVAAGWLPASNTDEVEDYIAKVLKYEKNPDLTEDAGGHTYMSRFVHLLADICLRPDTQERATYNLLAGFDKTQMYEDPQVPGGGPGDYPTYPQPHDVNDALDGVTDGVGYGIIEIDTHGSPIFHYILTQGDNETRGQVWASHPGRTSDLINNTVYPDTVEDLENDYYGIICSVSCVTNCFEYDGKDEADIISERYLFDEDGGGVAYLGNTRDGYPGDSAEVTHEFYRVLLNETSTTTDDNYFLGPAETWGCARYFGKKIEAPWVYRCAYTHVLCGDPELNVWTADPDELDMSVSIEDAGGGNSRIKVTISDKNTADPVYLANVCLHAPGENYLLNLSNEAGRCDFIVPDETSGKITATKHNWVPAWESFVAE